jgi:hypothetical protein
MEDDILVVNMHNWLVLRMNWVVWSLLIGWLLLVWALLVSGLGLVNRLTISNLLSDDLLLVRHVEAQSWKRAPHVKIRHRSLFHKGEFTYNSTYLHMDEDFTGSTPEYYFGGKVWTTLIVVGVSFIILGKVCIPKNDIPIH